MGRSVAPAPPNPGRLMAERTPRKERIEPSFGASKTARKSDELSVTAEDRVVAPAPRAKTATRKTAGAKTAGKAASGKPGGGKPKGGKAGRRGGDGTARRRIFKFLRTFVYWSFIAGIWAAIAALCVVGYYAVRLPAMSSWSIPARPPNARIVSVDGELIANRGQTGGEAMRLDEMSPYIPMAVIAIEDRRFKQHFGIDPIGLARALATNLLTGRTVQGGSTLTQQLAKNLFLEPERTLERKVQEAVLSIWLETKFTKDEILELYLNRVYFGAGAYGVDAAARRYFNKSARDVTLDEAAIIAGLLKAPSRYSPARDPKAAEARAQVVLGAMRRSGFITDREAARALAMQPASARRYHTGSQQYVADMVMAQLPTLIGQMRTDVVIDTTVDLDLQKLAGTIISDTIASKGAKLKISQGALVSLDGTGAIRALVGGRDYSESQYNRASDAERQPGSAFKPIVYLAALEAGRTPESVREDAPVRIGNWTPENYDRKYRGKVTLSTGLALSLNTVAAQLVMEVGPGAVIETAHRLGIRSTLQDNASIALGTSEVSLMELTGAYAPFANGGYAVTPWLIRRVTTNEGKLLYERKQPAAQPVVRASELGMMNAMLARVVAEGTGKRAAFPGWQIAGKTGTTQNSRDALFVGYTANLVTGIWYGNDDNSPTARVTGGTVPAESWSQFMAAAHKGVPVSTLPGRYVPPTPDPTPGGQIASGGDLPFAEGRNTFGVGETGGPRPGAEIGGADEPRRPRNILELLFGRRQG